jgi:peptidyl-prolyl cis-trans isomerase C
MKPERSVMEQVIEAPSAVTVNGVEITEETIAAEMQYHPAESMDAAYLQAVRALVVRELLLQQASRLGLDQPEREAGATETADDARIRLLIEQEVETPKADDDACRTYYDNNRHKFRTQVLLEASHILLPAPPDDVSARREARQQADAILAELERTPEAFEQLARTRSACPSGKEGGSLGQLTSGQTCEEFERQVFRLPQGLCPKPLETRYGYHIVRIDRRVEGKPLDYQMASDKIARYLDERVQRKALSQYIHYLAGEAEIDGIDLTDSDSPLMQ